MVTKKKIFFLLYSMDVGGVEKSLINLIPNIPRELFEVHIGLINPKGKLLSFLPSYVIVHNITDISSHWEELKNPPIYTIRKYKDSRQYIKAFKALVVYLVCKLQGSFLNWTIFLLNGEKGLDELFDTAIAYAGPSLDIDYYICTKITARQKIGWVHFDVSRFGVDRKAIRKLYRHYNHIFIVSEEGKEIFDGLFSDFQDKTEIFNNVVVRSRVLEQSNGGETFRDDFNGKRILTVGRISPEKGQRIALLALKRLIEKKYPVRWYFIGDGVDMENCKKDADKLGLNGYASFLGTKTNPYAYMRDCDVYMQPSLHEGFCITLAEALCFDKPIVSTNFTGAKEQLKNRENGYVVGQDVDSIVEGIENALNQNRNACIINDDETDIQKLLMIL